MGYGIGSTGSGSGFKFKSEFELDLVLSGGPRTFNNQVLMLRRWQPRMIAANVKFEFITLWIQIWGTPFDMVSLKVATKIGSRMGVVVEVEKRKEQDAQIFFMRVKVVLPVSKPIRRGAFLGASNRQQTWVTFKYERLPMFYHCCRMLGLNLKYCAQYFALKKNGGKGVCQYDDWLKSSGGVESISTQESFDKFQATQR